MPPPLWVSFTLLVKMHKRARQNLPPFFVQSVKSEKILKKHLTSRSGCGRIKVYSREGVRKKRKEVKSMMKIKINNANGVFKTIEGVHIWDAFVKANLNMDEWFIISIEKDGE